MVERYAFLKLEDPAARDELASRLRAALAGAGLQARVGVPADAGAEVWDLSIAALGTDLAAVAAVDRALDAVRDRAVVVKTWSFRT